MFNGFIGVLAIIAIIGWCSNAYKFANDDFAEPYKAEVLRGIGLFIAPLGVIEGYITYDEEKK